MDLTTYFNDHYKPILGLPEDTDDKLFLDYIENVLAPSARSEETRLASYWGTGQATKQEMDITVDVLAPLLDEGKQVIAPLTNTSGTEHIVSIFRPKLHYPAMVFNPATVDGLRHAGSKIRRFTSVDHENIIKHQARVVAVSIWDQAIVAALAAEVVTR